MYCWPVAALALVSSAAAMPAVCQDDEQTIFRCRTLNERVVSVCASKGFTARHGRLQYRYGPSGRVEIVLPAQETPPIDSAVMGRLMFSRGGGAALRFASGAYRYVVYSATSSYWGDKDGIGVYRNDDQIANHRCRGEAQVRLQTGLLKKAGIDYEDEAFDMPN
jgi:hypothetical protein